MDFKKIADTSFKIGQSLNSYNQYLNRGKNNPISFLFPIWPQLNTIVSCSRSLRCKSKFSWNHNEITKMQQTLAFWSLLLKIIINRNTAWQSGVVLEMVKVTGEADTRIITCYFISFTICFHYLLRRLLEIPVWCLAGYCLYLICRWIALQPLLAITKRCVPIKILVPITMLGWHQEENRVI